MSFLASIPILGDIIKGGTDIIKEFVTDKDKQIQAEYALKQLQLNAETILREKEYEVQKAQIEVNKEEAKSTNLFVSGWRPSIGWVCSIAFGCNFILFPLMSWILPIISVWFPEAKNITPPDPFSLSEMMPVLFGILGLGGMRSYEKKGGVARK